MLRLYFAQRFHELWKSSHHVASYVSKRRVLSFLPVSSACHHRLYIFAHCFSTGNSLWKEAPQPNMDKLEDTQTIDLNKWKSVMRAQAASEEKDVNNEMDTSNDENLKEPGGELKGTSTLEATRDLVAMWRQAGKLVPEEMTDDQVQKLSELTTKSSRKKYLKYLAIRQVHKKTSKEKQRKKAERELSVRQSTEQTSDAEEGHDPTTPELKNTFLLKYWTRSLDKILAWRSAQSLIFGQPLVFDLSYESYMSRREIDNTVSQLMEVEGWNRRATDPYHLHFCNLQPGGAYMQELLKRYGAQTWEHLLITTSNLHYVDLFPHEQLVYLTADSPNVLRTYDHSKVYIIGALVDRSIKSGLSFANAKRLKLATARLPLDEFLQWDVGAKNLTLDQMIRIMLTLKETGKWEEALKFVPTRKHLGLRQQQPGKEMTNKRVTQHGPREDCDRWLQFGEKTFKNEDQSLYRSYKQSGFTRRDRNAGLCSEREYVPAPARVRTSLKNSMEGRKSAGKSKAWWDSE